MSVNLTIFDILDNMVDELSRAEDLLSVIIAEDDTTIELLDDRRVELLDRARNLKERIKFALILAAYAGENNTDGENNVGSSFWCDEYIRAASDVELEFNDDGKITYDVMFNTADDIVREWFAKTEFEDMYPKTFKYVTENDTVNRRCNRCNRVVLKETFIHCLHCDENMFTFEVHIGNPHSDEEFLKLCENTLLLGLDEKEE